MLKQYLIGNQIDRYKKNPKTGEVDDREVRYAKVKAGMIERLVGQEEK